MLQGKGERVYCSNCGAAHQATANFCSGCGSRLTAPAAKPADPAPAEAQKAKILDAGDKILISGASAAVVEEALGKYLKDGARLVSPPSQVGSTWMAACGIPRSQKNMDDTQSLSLKDVKLAALNAIEDANDGCRVEELGFKRIIYGPTALAVKLRVDHLRSFGAEVVSEAEESDGEWVAVCDVGDAKNTGYRW